MSALERRSEPAAAADPRPQLARELFAFLEAAGVPACVIGMSEALPERIGGDLDMLVDPAQIRRLPRLVRDFARRHRALIVQALWQERTSWYIVLARFDGDGRPHFLLCDFYGAFLHDGRPLIGCRELLAGSRPAVGDDGAGKGFRVLAEADEFICYFLKKVAKKELDAAQAAHLTAVFRADPGGAVARLRRYWPPADADLVAAAAGRGDWSAVRPALARLGAALRRPAPSRAARLRELPRILYRLRRPTGLWIAVLGPDGSGKSTLLDRLLPEVAPAFRQTRVFHLRPGTPPAPTPPGVVDDPHGLPPRSLPESLAKLVYYFLLYKTGYWLWVWPLLVRSGFVAFDRYYHDMLIDSYRYRYEAPRWMARLVGRMLPHPDIWIGLDAPAEVIYARKREVALPELRRQCEAYREFVRKVPGGHVVDASLGADQTARLVARIVVEHLAERTSRRFG